MRMNAKVLRRWQHFLGGTIAVIIAAVPVASLNAADAPAAASGAGQAALPDPNMPTKADYAIARGKEMLVKEHPELLLPMHGAALRGEANIRSALTHQADALQHIVDQTVDGLNRAVDIYVARIMAPDTPIIESLAYFDAAAAARFRLAEVHAKMIGH